jgi:hypothetical protein
MADQDLQNALDLLISRYRPPNDDQKAILHQLSRIERQIDTLATTQADFDAVFTPFIASLTDYLAKDVTYQSAVAAFIAATAAGTPATDLAAEAAAVTTAQSELAAAAGALAASQGAIPVPTPPPPPPPPPGANPLTTDVSTLSVPLSGLSTFNVVEATAGAALSVNSSDVAVATAELAGTVVTVNGVAAGSASVIVSDGTNVATVSVTVA